MMLETAAYLGTGLFFGLIVLFIYRLTISSKQIPKRSVSALLRTERTSLLERQRVVVTNRRNLLKSVSEPKTNERTKLPEETHPISVSEDTTDVGFGEDLGSALSIEQNQDMSSSEKPKRNAGRSRFAALQEAADQFKDIYNRNSQL